MAIMFGSPVEFRDDPGVCGICVDRQEDSVVTVMLSDGRTTDSSVDKLEELYDYRAWPAWIGSFMARNHPFSPPSPESVAANNLLSAVRAVIALESGETPVDVTS